jgi:diaminopimelate epimerase
VIELKFEKYQGTGNDFVMIHNPDWQIEFSNEEIKRICNRRFGVGADGLIMVGKHPEYDFEMRYFNADGSRSFCGNGARCAVQFARSLDYFSEHCAFLAIDGVHEAKVVNDNSISLKMKDVNKIEVNDQNDYILNTGSPHYIRFVKNLEDFNIIRFGKDIRYNTLYSEKGINVNLAEFDDRTIHMLTYERGVEDETLSCGTGATAVGLAFRKKKGLTGQVETFIRVKGGNLKVISDENKKGFHNIFLIGPAEKVFEGFIVF